MGDAIGTGIVYHLSKAELEALVTILKRAPHIGRMKSNNRFRLSSSTNV
jgi:hypothetical protein